MSYPNNPNEEPEVLGQGQTPVTEPEVVIQGQTPVTESVVAPENQEATQAPQVGAEGQCENVAPQPESATGYVPQPGAPVGFDPQTGAPIYGAEPQATPIQPLEAPKKKIWPAILAGVAVLVVVVLIAAFALSNVFLSAPNKVLLATKKTFTHVPSIVNDLGFKEVNELAKDGDIAFDIQMKAGDIDGNINYAASVSEGKMQVSTDLIGEVGTLKVEGGMEDDFLKIQLPDITEDVFVYEYNEKPSGYVAELLAQEDSFDLEEINEEIKNTMDSFKNIVVSEKDNEKAKEALEKNFYGWFKELDWKKLDAKELNVNGKVKTVKGNGFSLTKEQLIALLNVLEESVKGQAGYDEDSYKIIRDAVNDEYEDGSVSCGFYLAGGKLAFVEMSFEEYLVEIAFEGTEYPTQLVRYSFYEDGDLNVALAIEGKSTEQEESWVVTKSDSKDSSGTVFAEVKYSKNDKRLEVYVMGTKVGKMEISSTEDSFSYSIASDLMDVSVDVDITNKIEFEELNGKEVKVWELTEDDVFMYLMSMYY